MKSISIISVVLLLSLNAHLCAADEAQKALEATKEAYRSAESFSCDGTVTIVTYQNEIPRNNLLTIDFSIKLKKPNLFLMHWKRRRVEPGSLELEGALWSSGEETYFYVKSFSSYFSFLSPENAFTFTGGISSGVTYTIPQLFLTSIFSENNWLDKLQDPEVYRDGDISTTRIKFNHAQIPNTTFGIDISTKNSFIVKSFTRRNWTITKNIRLEELRKSKERSLITIRKYRNIIGVTDEEGFADTDNMVLKRFDQRIKEESALPDYEHKMRTYTTENYTNISTRPLAVDDFTFQLPAGVDFQGYKLEEAMEKK